MRFTKVILLSSIYAPLTMLPLSATEPSKPVDQTISYNGFSAGFDMGLVSADVSFPEQAEKNKKGKIIRKHSPFDRSLALHQFPVGVHIDYHMSGFQKEFYKDLYLGLGLSAGTSFGNPSKNVLSGKGNLGHGLSLNGDVTLKQRRRFYAELTPKFGVKFNNQGIFYVLLAVRHSQLDSTLSSTNDIRKAGNLYLAKGTYKNKSSRVGVAPGLGFDAKLGQHWSMGAEYKYFFEKGLKFADGKIKASSGTHNLLAKVSYHF
jgi:opacity protein-like surface antigen